MTKALTLNIRMSDPEKRRLEKLAKKWEMGMSATVRRAVKQAADAESISK